MARVNNVVGEVEARRKSQKRDSVTPKNNKELGHIQGAHGEAVITGPSPRLTADIWQGVT